MISTRNAAEPLTAHDQEGLRFAGEGSDVLRMIDEVLSDDMHYTLQIERMDGDRKSVV